MLPFSSPRTSCASLIAGAVLLCATASAQTTGTVPANATVITQVPYSITQSGVYVINNNLFTTQNANLITISPVANVTIDFQGNTIGCTNPSIVCGIYAYNCDNLTIRNGSVVNVDQGIAIDRGNLGVTLNKGLRIENMRLTNCTYTGINVLSAPAGSVTNCTISQIGSTNVSASFGVLCSGTGVTIQGCTIANIIAQSGKTTYGINASGAGNYISQNQVTNAVIGFSGGIRQNNLASFCSTPFTAGTDGGGNVSGN